MALAATAAGEQTTDPSPEGVAGEQVTDPSPAPTGEQVDDPSPEDVFASQMGKAGEILDGGETSPPEPADPNLPPPPQEPWVTAPQHWPKDQQAEFNSLPDNQKRFLYNSYRGMNADYQQKASNLAEMRQTLSEFVANLPLQQQPAPQPQAPPEPIDDTPPEDIVERIKWETKREIRDELDSERQKESINKLRTTINQLNAKVSADPLKSQAMNVLNARVNMEPNVVNPFDPRGRTYRQIEYDRLDSDPVYFESCYVDARTRVMQQQQQQQQVAVAPQPTGQPRRTVTPALERAGVGAPAAPVDQNAKRKQSIVENIRRGRATSATLKDYLSTVNVQL